MHLFGRSFYKRGATTEKALPLGAIYLSSVGNTFTVGPFLMILMSWQVHLQIPLSQCINIPLATWSQSNLVLAFKKFLQNHFNVEKPWEDKGFHLRSERKFFVTHNFKHAATFLNINKVYRRIILLLLSMILLHTVGAIVHK